jgi:hypothetical protein
MTAVAMSPRRLVRRSARLPWGAAVPFAAAGRLLRLEMRRNVMIWVLPLLGALFWFDAYRTAMSYPAVWDLRASVMPDKVVIDFATFVAGASAWMGSRETRCRAADLVTTTGRPGWARLSATLAATLAWVMAGYLACVAVLYGATAAQATWGTPPWWPVAVGAAALAAACAAGFAAGASFANRFVPWLTAVAVFGLEVAGFRSAVGVSGGYRLLSPSASVPGQDTGLFHPYLPDLAIAQVMFLTGLAVAALGALGLSRAAGAGIRLRCAAAAVAVAGLAAAGVATGLVGTARAGPDGVVIGVLHDAASDHPVPYTPVCADPTGVPVCIHPAFRPYLAEVTAALRPALSLLAGLPGAPVRVSEVATSLVASTNQQAEVAGRSPVYDFAMPPTPGSLVRTAGESFTQSLQIAFVTTVIGGSAPGPNGPETGDLAQQAVETVLLRQVAPELTNDTLGPPGSAAAVAAIGRFAALSPAARHAWLAGHLGALQAGRITLEELP